MNMTLVNIGLVFLDITLFFAALYTTIGVGLTLYERWEEFRERKEAASELTD